MVRPVGMYQKQRKDLSRLCAGFPFGAVTEHDDVASADADLRGEFVGVALPIGDSGVVSERPVHRRPLIRMEPDIPPHVLTTNGRNVIVVPVRPQYRQPTLI